MNKSRKIISIVAAATLAFSTLALAGCGTKKYAGEKLNAADAMENVTSNGGFAVETDGFVYFINGSGVSTDDNTYGDVVKASLMRISKAELSAGQYSAAQIVVPSLFVASYYDAGIYIYDGYVYYATPTTDKNTKTGQVENSYLDIKRSKLDGSEAPMGGKNDYFFRLSSNSAKYRFVEVDDTVYCLFEEDSKLKSFNVETGKTTVLVSGAKSSFFYDLKDPTNPNVYYTMGVTYDLDKKTSTTAQYDQIYCVNAAATATTDKAKASYTVYNGETQIASYDFDEKFMKENAEDKGYDLGDYTTYPYVNLGSLVLDGVGSAPSPSNDNRFNKDDKAASSEPLGYNYTIQNYQNDGLYFTRTAITTTASETENAKLYYLADEKAADWNTVTGNTKADVVALDTTNASSSALFEIAEDGTHSYIYLSGTILKKATADENGVATEIKLAYEVSSATLWKTEGDYLYYYSASTNGNNITRINYKGDEEYYKLAQALHDPDYVEYKPQTLPLVDWNSAWYKPEFVTGANGEQIVLYSNAQSYGAGTTSYNYIYATKLGTTEEMIARQDDIDEINEFIDSYTDNSQLQAVMDYYYKTGETAAFDAVKDVEDLYTEYQKTEFDAFKAKFAEGGEYEGRLESSHIALVGRMTEDDQETIYENWANSLLSEKEEEEEESCLPTWAIVLIVVGGVIVVAAAVTVPLVISAKKKAEAKRRAEATVNAYKRKKIDTTDDKSIDVYAEEEETATEETVEEASEEAATEEAEETTEEAVETAAEEVSEEE